MVCAVLVAACNREPSGTGTTGQAASSEGAAGQGTAPQTQVTPPAPRPAEPAAEPAKSADNTGVNVRDRSDAAVTPGSQNESSADVEVTRRVRQAISHEKELSTLAKNIKVVDTGAGKIVLRGPVNNDAEKQQIGQLAAGVQGVSSVDNQLEVKTNQ